MDKPDYGNWVPQRVSTLLLISSTASLLLSYFLFEPVATILKIASLLLALIFIYLQYVYWLLEKDGKAIQYKFWNTLIDALPWDGVGRALDIGTGSGPVAILLAKRYPQCYVEGLDYWGKPWTYSKEKCDVNARIEGVSERVKFVRGSAVNLPYGDGQFDAVLSNFVFHAVRGQDRMGLIAEALRVLREGGSFAFQDLFNDDYYEEDFLDVVKGWGLREVNFLDSKKVIEVPMALRIKSMTGGSGILYGVK